MEIGFIRKSGFRNRNNINGIINIYILNSFKISMEEYLRDLYSLEFIILYDIIISV